mmetsp:Transcript_33098/g.38946  ORF Transcript_33098/g.38946 Transcript_33098/m.38946 type:complete len:90 (+) Transcript_33098:1914-2183(+)
MTVLPLVARSCDRLLQDLGVRLGRRPSEWADLHLLAILELHNRPLRLIMLLLLLLLLLELLHVVGLIDLLLVYGGSSCIVGRTDHDLLA